MIAGPQPPPGSRPVVVVPTYNEVASLPGLLGGLLALRAPPDVLVVDDNSPDGTADMVRGHPDFGRRIFLLSRPSKMGLGSAYRDAFQWAILQGYTAAVEIDADLSHDPNDVPRLIAALDAGADMAIGSRYSEGVNVIHWPLRRLLLSIGAGLYARLFTGLRLADPTSGFKAIRREVIERLDWGRIAVDGYGFQIALHFYAQRRGFRLVEVPIVFTERRSGCSKLSRRIAFEAFGLVLKLAVVRMRDALLGRPRGMEGSGSQAQARGEGEPPAIRHQ
ncbi:MAG TPA: polyprenol monophosphomannose synthase [Opitutaceae bacterium]|nr:polyprenol monophosphomannose synthase [Opitutaceae bacterium]